MKFLEYNIRAIPFFRRSHEVFYVIYNIDKQIGLFVNNSNIFT